MADPPGPEDARWLRVHVRTTASATGQQRASSVFCPGEQTYVPVGNCSSCRFSFGLDRRDREAFLICQPPGVGAAAVVLELPPPPTRGPLHQIDRVPVGEVMTRDVLCVTRDLSLGRLLALLLEHEVSGLPVVDAAGEPIGVVSKTDVIHALRRLVADDDDDGADVDLGRLKLRFAVQPGALDETTVADIMAPLVFALPEAASVARAAAMMAYEGVHRVPIVDDGNVVIGLLSSADVLRWVAQQAGYVLPDAPSR
jgi:CBS domain-containing protein